MSLKGLTPIADAERTDPTTSRAPLPSALKDQLRRLLTKILVMDYRAEALTADPNERSKAR